DDVVGPLTPVFGYMVMPQPGLAPKVTKGPIAYPPKLPKQPKKTLRLTSFNVENFFPPGATDDGHTYTEAEYEAKRDAIADASDGFLGRPDVIGMQEVADLPGRLNPAQDLAHILGGYRAYILPSNDARGIAPAFLVKKGVKVSNLRQFGRAEQYDG